jgi:predicted ArsR family transcriptional regulator
MLTEEIEELNPITKEVLYCILRSDGKLKTSKICGKFHYRDTRVRSQLQQLRERNMVDVDKHQEYGGNAKKTNCYTSTSKAAEYERQHGLEVPKYVPEQVAGEVPELKKRIDELERWKQFDDEWKDAVKNRMERLEQIVEPQSEQIVEHRKEIQELKRRLDD